MKVRVGVSVKVVRILEASQQPPSNYTTPEDGYGWDGLRNLTLPTNTPTLAINTHR